MAPRPRFIAADTPLPLGRAMVAIFARDVRAGLRQRQDLLNPVVFFVMVVALFPLGVSPESGFLRQAGPGILWVAALLSTLLSLDHLFRHDHDQGVLDQMLLQPQPLYLLVLAKVSAHWMLTGLPLVLISPLLGLMLQLEGNSLWALCLTLLLGTPVLSFIGAIGAALTLGLRSAGVLLSLLVIPLYIPVLIFGTGTVMSLSEGLPVSGHFALLGAMLVLAVLLAPLAVAGALRISVSNG
ncbi:heme exporter protein CcmB [Tamilnaduibacter salinus]